MSDGKKLVADAITQKGVATAADAAFQTMADNVKKIETGILTDDATAVASNILTGKTAYAKGAKITGTMANRGAVSQTLGINGSYTIPAGYHNGSGKVTQSVPTQGAQTITPGTANKTIASGRYLTGTQTIKGDANLKAANIKSGVSIFGVAGTYSPPSTSGYLEALRCCINNLDVNANKATLVTKISVGDSEKFTFPAGTYVAVVQGSSGSLAWEELTIGGADVYSDSWGVPSYEASASGLYFAVTATKSVTFYNSYNRSYDLNIYKLPK